MKDRNDLPMLAVKRPFLIAVLNLLIIIAGAAALMGVDVRELPDVDRPIVTVTASFPGAAPETMDSEVTSVLEGAVARVSGIRQIQSSSEENSSRIRVEFNPGVNLDTAAADVREAVSRVTRQLPDRVEQVTVVKADDNAQSVLTLAVQSRAYGEAELTTIVENDIVPELLTAQGVASINQFGSRPQQLRVAIDPQRLNRFGLTISDVAEALQGAPFDVPVGSFRSNAQELIVRAEANASDPDRIKDVVISGTTRVGDVAEAFFAPADATSFVRLNGERAIGLGVIRQANSNTIDISNSIRATVERLADRFPQIQMQVIADDAEFIRHSVREVAITLSITVLVVVVTMLVFFGAVRPTIIPSAAIPVSLVGVVAGIWLMGFSINLLTLLALVLATGLIVDDAIVVLENAQRLQKKGLGRRAAAVIGTRQVFFALIATTAVLVSVFVPISFLPSEAGRLFREFGFVLALAVMLSSFVALSLVPALSARTVLTSERKGGRLAEAGTWLMTRYSAGLRRCLDRPRVVIGASVAVAGACALLYIVLPAELVPDEDRGTVMVNASGPDGVGIDYMDRQMDEIETVLQPLFDSGEMISALAIVGRYDPNRIQVMGMLADWGERERSQTELVASLREPLQDIPGSRVNPSGRGTLSLGGSGGGDVIEVALLGPDYQEIFLSAQALAEAIDTQSDILSNAEISYQPTQPQLSIQIDRRSAADLGVDLNDLSLTLRAMVGGDEVVDLNIGDQSIPVFMTAEAVAVTNPEDLRNLYVRGANNSLIPLSSVTVIEEQGIAAELERVEQRRAITVEAAVPPEAPLQDAVDEIRLLASETLADDIDLVMQGEAESLAETSNDLLLTFAFALVIVFLVLVAQFESLTSALVVMLSVPFALAAAILTLFLTGVSLNIYSQIGLVMLIGLMAKNGILIVEFADQLRHDGRSVREAVEEAASIRLRPIAMTLISTVIGAVPLIIASGAGAEARQAIGWVIFGGLGIAAIFTLFLTPVLYLTIARFGKPRSMDLSRLREEIANVDESEALAAG